MYPIPAGDTKLESLVGAELPAQSGGQHRLLSLVGCGGMGSVFESLYTSASGTAPAVVKVIHPEFLRASPEVASVSLIKEATSLERLTQRRSGSPYIVGFRGHGSFAVAYGDQAMNVPWLALEFVNGGEAGTTLSERLAHSVEMTGAAFGAERAIRVIRCLASALQTIHAENIIHRDLKPSNVLCCGWGEGEIFKLADFGIARPLGVAETFAVSVGTQGYAPPEQLRLEQEREAPTRKAEQIDQLKQPVGPATDVFAFAATTYYMLTGRNYFDAESPAEAIALVRFPQRKSILQERTLLAPGLRQSRSLCANIDSVLAQATNQDPRERPQSAEQLAASLIGLLESTRPQSRSGLGANTSAPLSVRKPGERAGDPKWRWHSLSVAEADLAVRDVSWASDGSALVITNRDVRIWNGVGWESFEPELSKALRPFDFALSSELNQWLLGGGENHFALLEAAGLVEQIPVPARGHRYTHASGDLHDLLVAVSVGPGGEVYLHGGVCGRWLKSLPVPNAASITGISRLADNSWLVAGRCKSGRGLAAIYQPLQWELSPADPPGAAPDVRAFTCCDARPELHRGAWAAPGGIIMSWQGLGAKFEHLPEPADISALALETSGALWAASRQGLWQKSGLRSEWSLKQRFAEGSAPVVSLFADSGHLVALSASGAITEGRVPFGLRSRSNNPTRTAHRAR